MTRTTCGHIVFVTYCVDAFGHFQFMENLYIIIAIEKCSFASKLLYYFQMKYHKNVIFLAVRVP